MNEKTLEKLQELNDVLSTKENYYLTYNFKETIHTARLPIPIKLNSNRKYECGLQYFSSTNYLLNITEYNNRFYYSVDKGKTWILITLEKGAYELVDINSEIKRLMNNNKHTEFTIEVKLSTYQSYIEIKDDTYMIDFTRPKSIKDILGFSSKILSKGYNISDYTVQITNVSSILISCDLISGSYHNNKEANVIYSFPACMVPSGYKMNIIPPTMIYLPVTKTIINNITFKITDQDFNELDFKNEMITLALHIKQI
jgi:hypothetical protein